ncbi:MAG: 1,4-dihydroxy-2-naphthoate polyprenyltransferase, partial [FCB group bacterium]|nr:1,4-dihydroxy-2-naphthoate polyprenyltransferase [FCB group bacterium]
KFLFLIIAPVMIRHAVEVLRVTEPAKLDPYLKKLALNTFLFALLLGISVNL